ncbi:MAG: hypothetical protein HY791_25585 [Deltaproteobacteria bacterium]|nr:hypothetical protein [Deltaproteobacteria bacterium]
MPPDDNRNEEEAAARILSSVYAGEGGALRGVVRSFRRVRLPSRSGYYERLQRPANIVYFFYNICGVSCILRSMEQGPTSISYEPRYPPPSGDDYRLIKRASAKQYVHYYFYVMDPLWP